jgi:hypothetical protein
MRTWPRHAPGKLNRLVQLSVSMPAVVGATLVVALMPIPRDHQGRPYGQLRFDAPGTHIR